MTAQQGTVLILALWALFITVQLVRIAGSLEQIASSSGPPSMSGIEHHLRGIVDLMPRREVTGKPGRGFVASGLPQVYAEPLVFPESWKPPEASSIARAFAEQLDPLRAKK